MARRTQIAPTEEEISFEHGWAAGESESRYSLDQRIRALGYTIAARPGQGEPMWTRFGVEYLQSELIFLYPGLNDVK